MTTTSKITESERLALLKRASNAVIDSANPERQFENDIRNLAVELLGGVRVFGCSIGRSEELVAALIAGFPGATILALQGAGYPHKVLEQVVAPRRTLMRRRAPGQRLSRSESDAVWRLAYVLAMASTVLNGRGSALSWLMRPKPVFGNSSPIDLLETSVGTDQVHRLLRRMEWGDVA